MDDTHDAAAQGTRRGSLVDGLLEVGWLSVAILAPLAVNLWAQQPFDPWKAILVRTLVWAMGALWLADYLLRPQAASPADRALAHPLFWPVLGLAVVLVAATFAAQNPLLSLSGSYDRGQGTLTLISYILLFLIVADRLRTAAQARRLVAALVTTAVPIVVLGVAQALGYDPLGLVTDARSPVYATLGRANFVGAYLAMLLPLTLLPTVATGDRERALGGLALTVVEIAVIALCRSRAAWLAAGAGLAVTALLWAWPRLPWFLRVIGVFALLVMPLPAVGGVIWLAPGGGSPAARLTIWRATLDLIRWRPLLGFGPEALITLFPRVYPPQLVYYQGRGVMVDRAHNLILDWAVTAGVIGVAAWLLILGVFFASGTRVAARAGRDPERAWLIAALGSIAALVAGDLVGFQVTATSVVMWLLLAALPVLATMGSENDDVSAPTVAATAPPSTDSGARVQQGLRVIAVVLVWAITLGVILQVNVRPAVADILARSAERRLARGDWLGSAQAAEQAVRLWPGEPAHRQRLSRVYLLQAVQNLDNAATWLALAEDELLAARDLRPGDFRIWADLGELYGIWSNGLDPAKLDAADAAYEQAVALAPNHATVHADWGWMHLMRGGYAEAETHLQRAVELDATYGRAFTLLGQAQLSQGDLAEARTAFSEATRWTPDCATAHLGLAVTAWQLGDEMAARVALDRALALNPDDPTAQALHEEMSATP